MAEITDFPVIQPTAEEKAAYEQQFGPPPLNPIRDLSASELADLASADKENFEIVSAFRQNQELWGNPEIVNKVADAHNQIKQRGFSLSDLPTVPRAAGMVWDVAKGFGKQLWNYGTAAVTGGLGLAADIAGARGIAEELGEEGTRRIAENIAGTEQALFGLSEMAARTAQKTGRALGISKPLTQFTPQEKVNDLWGAVGVGATQEDISRGAGGFLTPVGGEVIRELAEEGKPVRPEEVNTLAAGDPFSFYLFGKGFQAAGAAVPAPVRAGVRQAGQKIAAGAEQAAGATVRALGNLTDLGGRAAQITGRVAPVVASGAAVASGEPITALAILGGSRPAARGLQTAGRKISAGGQSIVEAGRQVAGKPVVSPSAQVIKDVAFSTPGAIGEVISGTAADIGLAAVSSESPQQTESAVGIGTVFGAAAGARRVAGRVISGQLIAPREYGVTTPVPSSGNFPAFDTLHSTAYSAAPPGVRARLNAVREFVRGAGIDSDVFLAPDAAALEKVLTDAGVAPETARQFSEQEGFFTTSLPDRSGTPRRVIVARNVEATPHESFHAFQDVLGESANQQLDALVRQEYASEWEQQGNLYAKRLTAGNLGNRSWEEVVLDASGWGIDAAKEKIYREVHNRLESETGAAPSPEVVRDLADPELVRIFNEAQSRNPGTSPEQFWREVLSPEEAKAEADRYIARELAAENFDAVFKNRGTTLTSGTTIPERLARVIGNVVSTLGGEPLAGRRSEIGQIEPRFAVTEEVARLAREGAPGAPPRAPAGTPPVITPRGTPGPVAGPAEEARALADSAPETPLAGGTRSPRELLGQIAEAIAQQAGVKLNYLSAPGEPAAATTSNRTARRAIIEAFRTMPAAARSLWEKTFFPERVRKTKAGYQIQGWAPEVFASNAHKLAETLSSLPDGQRLTPYELDVANKTFTEAGWRQLFEDTQTFVRNQMAGQTGAGEPLVVPAGVAERGFFAPPSTPSRATGLEQTRADAINMLFNFRLPDTPRVESGKLPLNIAGQEVSIATAGGPQRLSVPVEPRAPFSGERAQELGIEGRTILEVNPARAAIEQATSQAGIAMPSFVEAIQRLNLENIKEVQLAPEVPQFRGNTLTLSAGFQPSTNPRAIKAAAVRDSEGKIYEGAWHGEAEDIAVSLGSPTARGEFHTGFTTHGGEYLDRNQAYQRAQELQQISEADLKEFQTRVGPQLEAATFHAVKQFQPVAETAQRMVDMTPEEWKATIGKYKGKLGGGLTGWAWDTGASAKSADDVLALRAANSQLSELAKTISIAEPGGFDRKMEIVGRIQAAREAYEAATGQNLEGTGEGSALPAIRKFVDPNYKPPVPLGEVGTRASMQAKFQAQPVAPKVAPDEGIRELAKTYAKSAQIDYVPSAQTLPIQEDVSRRLADFYEGAPHTPDDPEVQKAYSALSDETISQYRAIANAGYTVEPWTEPGEPYSSSADMLADVRNNKHLYFLPTTGAFDDAGNNLMLKPSGVSIGGRPLSINDVFRAVHDFFGHAKEGHQFGPRGELNAWVAHSEMFSPNAQGALAAETLAQNSWVNFGQHLRNSEGRIPARGEPGFVGPTDRPFAQQKNLVVPAELIQQARGQLQPEQAGESPEYALRKPSGGFSKAWITPSGQPVQLGGKWHHEWLNENAEQYGITTGVNADAESRVQALRKGFARINYGQNGGRLTIEARAVDWPKLRPSIQQFIETNLDQIDNLRVELFNDDVSAVADSELVRFMNMESDVQRLSSIPFMESAPTGGATGGQVTGIAQARSRQFQPVSAESAKETVSELAPQFKKVGLIATQVGSTTRGKGNDIDIAVSGSGDFEDRLEKVFSVLRQQKGWQVFDDPLPAADRENSWMVSANRPDGVTIDVFVGEFQPKSDQQEFAEFPESTSKPFLTTAQLGSMNRNDLMAHFPEAVVPRRLADSIPSELTKAPLIKNSENPTKTFGDKLTEFARSVESTPEYQMGRKWYSEFAEQLKQQFGPDARIFAELLAATSPQTSVETNFKFALDALEGFKTGRFRTQIKKFEQGLSMMANDSWKSWYNKELKAGRISDPPAKPTPAAFMARWIEAHDLKPRQSNGKLYGINSIPVLHVAARRWLEQNKGPKVKNFVENLLGEGTEATIDLWADRTLRRLGYSGFEERWRILPINKRGVSDEDFEFAQAIFRNAAQQLGMKPSELQAAVWFAEKKHWADNGWVRLDLGDFREQLKKTEAIRAEIRGREESPTPDLLSVEPRAIKR